MPRSAVACTLSAACCHRCPWSAPVASWWSSTSSSRLVSRYFPDTSPVLPDLAGVASHPNCPRPDRGRSGSLVPQARITARGGPGHRCHERSPSRPEPGGSADDRERRPQSAGRHTARHPRHPPVLGRRQADAVRPVADRMGRQRCPSTSPMATARFGCGCGLPTGWTRFGDSRPDQPSRRRSRRVWEDPSGYLRLKIITRPYSCGA